jgi:hypothetical protein
VDEDGDVEQSHTSEARRSARPQRAGACVDKGPRIVSLLLRKRPTRNRSELILFVEVTSPDSMAIVASLDGAASRVPVEVDGHRIPATCAPRGGAVNARRPRQPAERSDEH